MLRDEIRLALDHRLQLPDAMRVTLLFGELNVGLGDGIEVIVGERDEAKSETP
jgi:hypothetical protein